MVGCIRREWMLGVPILFQRQGSPPSIFASRALSRLIVCQARDRRLIER